MEVARTAPLEGTEWTGLLTWGNQGQHHRWAPGLCMIHRRDKGQRERLSRAWRCSVKKNGRKEERKHMRCVADSSEKVKVEERREA